MLKNIRNAFVFVAVTVWSLCVSAGEQVTYYHNDLQGTPIAATNDRGYLMWRSTHEPYGEKIQVANDYAASADNRRGFTSHEHDVETDLVYMQARYYDPIIGRFLSVDPVGFDEKNTQSFGRYTYAYNSPYRYVDPDGRIPLETFWDAGNVIYDVGKITVGWVTGNNKMVVEGSTDLLLDALATVTPYVPAGTQKIGREVIEQTVKHGDDAARGGAGAVARDILGDAARGRGNFGLGSGTRAEAEKLGREWVGEGYRIASDGKTMLSSDGLRQFRPPSFKTNLGIEQANFEQRLQASGKWLDNGHLDIVP